MQALLGIDVGFSKLRATTGIAWLRPDGRHFGARARSDWPDRTRCLPPDFSPGIVAIDGPVLPAGAPPDALRSAERVLARGDFARRCKPGFSHFGQGLALRMAAGVTADCVRSAFAGSDIIEAFPNAFLGVMLPEVCFEARRPLKRGQKFDWLYEMAMERGVFDALLEFIGLDVDGLAGTIAALEDHEIRSAYVCLLTAACRASRKIFLVGDAEGGWIALPHQALWADWARSAMLDPGVKSWQAEP